MSFTIETLPALNSNYIFLLSDRELGLAMVIDPGDGALIAKTLKERDLYLALILNTHHHPDHTGGNEILQQEFGAPVIGPLEEKGQIPGISRGVTEGDIVTFSTLRGRVMPTHGHTDGHVSYYFPSLGALFSGDTLFPFGCGRLVEGTTAQMWKSLRLIRDLPDNTMIYPSHELAEENAQFALSLDKKDLELQKRVSEILARRKEGKPSIPMLLSDEKRCNPFLRTDQLAFRKILAEAGIAPIDANPEAVFGLLRSAKDHFGQTSL